MAKKSIKKKTTQTKKRVKSRSTVPKGEVLMILVLFASFIIIAVSKCNVRKQKMNTYEIPKSQETPKDTIVLVESNHLSSNKHVDTSSIIIASPTIPPSNSIYSALFVVVDSLKMRKGPFLDSTVIQILRLEDVVYFMNETTDFTQKINLGNQLYDEPWIKIRSKQGKIGWSYGGGLNYYKIKSKE